MKFFLLISLSALLNQLLAKEGDEIKCTIGNFALSPSQQPGPLVSFGENIIGANQVQLYFFGDAYIGKDKHYVDLIPQVLYGITDNFSLFFNVPIAATYREGKQSSSGLEDLLMQLEYAFLARQSECSSTQATIVANISFPTGSTHKQPPTGYGAIAYFIGATYNHTWAKWYCFTSYGAQLTTTHDQTKFGNQFLYQLGVGRNITSRKGWIFAWLLELDGTYYQRDKIHGKTNSNSGGNVIYLTPSFWASSKEWIFQLGLGYAVEQHLFGNQKPERLLCVFNLGRTF